MLSVVLLILLVIFTAFIVSWVFVYKYHVLGSWGDCGKHCEHGLTDDSFTLKDGFNPSILDDRLVMRYSTPDKSNYQLWRFAGYMWSKTFNRVYSWNWETRKTHKSFEWRKEMSSPSFNKQTWFGVGRDIIDIRLFKHPHRGYLGIGCYLRDDLWSPAIVEMQHPFRLLEWEDKQEYHEKNWTLIVRPDNECWIHSNSNNGNLTLRKINISEKSFTLGEKIEIPLNVVNPPDERWTDWHGGCNWLEISDDVYFTAIHSCNHGPLDSRIYRTQFVIVDWKKRTTQKYKGLACLDHDHSKIQFVTCLTRDHMGKIWVGMGINDSTSHFVRLKDEPRVDGIPIIHIEPDFHLNQKSEQFE